MLILLGKNVALLWILRILAVPVVLVLFAAGFMPSHLRCAAGRAIQAWASIWIVRALSNIAIGRRTCLFPQAAQPPIGTQQT